MKKICIISPSLKLGGIERALTTLSEEFLLLGYEIHFIVCLKAEHFYKLSSSIFLYEPSFKRRKATLDKVLFYPRLIGFLRRNVKNINPDRVLVFGDWFSPVVLLALYGKNYPVYISDRTIPNYSFRFPIPFLKKWLYPKSAGFIAQTHRARLFKIKKFGSKLRIEVIPNALPVFKDTQISRGNNHKKILYVGRFAWEKDPEILIRAMAILRERFSDWHLEMAGGGPLLSPMNSLVEELNLSNHIQFLGQVTNVGSLYASADLLVLPSIVEGFPNTLIEGMSFGLPCVCFSDIPFEEIIQDEVDGFVVFERSALALSRKLEYIIQNDDLRLQVGLNAKESVTRFYKESIARRFISFLDL